MGRGREGEGKKGWGEGKEEGESSRRGGGKVYSELDRSYQSTHGRKFLVFELKGSDMAKEKGEGGLKRRGRGGGSKKVLEFRGRDALLSVLPVHMESRFRFCYADFLLKWRHALEQTAHMYV